MTVPITVGLTVAALATAGACGGNDRPVSSAPPGPTAGAASVGGGTPDPQVGPGFGPGPEASPLTPESTGTPVRVRIPDTGVDAAVVPVGVKADGDMEVPSAEDVGWYRFGPPPGEPGSAVLAAHVDFGGRPGAFLRLRELAPGAVVTVDYVGGATRSFQVTRSDRYSKDSLPDAVFRRGGDPQLALITCGGEFDRDARSYRDNVVVYARDDDQP